MLRRRVTGFLAVLALVFYGLAPALAYPAPREGCGDAAKSCACPMTGKADCCCKGPITPCGMSKRPCQPRDSANRALWTSANPLQLPTVDTTPSCPLPARARVLRMAAALRVVTLDTLSPPPQR